MTVDGQPLTMSFDYEREAEEWLEDQRVNLVVNALDMAIKNRAPTPGGVVHADHGTQFTSWAFTNKIRSSGMMPSFGSIGDGLDNEAPPV